MNRKLLVRICYCGTNYHGFQIQPNGDTIAARLMDAIEKVTGARSSTVGCSRTDAGVHANEFFFHFETESKISCEKFPSAMNAHLPYDIAVLDCKEAESEFHARYHARGKEYIYQIHNRLIRDPFCENTKLHYRRPIDVELLNRAAQEFVGTHDFAACCSAGSSVTDTVRTIYQMKVNRIGDTVTITVRGSGFLYNMVRIMVGTLLSVNEEKIQPNEIGSILSSKDRSKAGVTVPAHGLYLNRVFYDASYKPKGGVTDVCDYRPASGTAQTQSKKND